MSAEDGAARVICLSYRVSEGGYVEESIASRSRPEAVLRAMMAYSREGEVLELTARVDGQRRLMWIAPAGQWRVFALFQVATGQQVKRAAPGGEGNVVDHFSATALAHYLAPFDQPFADLPDPDQVRCFFNDSYEVYEAN